MAQEKFTMPQSTAGLVRYFEESQEAIKIKPEQLAGVLAVVVVLEIALRFLF